MQDVIRVGVIEGQALFRDAWTWIVASPDLALVVVAGSAEELPHAPCDVVVIDVDGLREPCASVIRQVRSRVGQAAVCALTLHPTLDVLASRLHGEASIVLKSASPAQVCAAIRNAHNENGAVHQSSVRTAP